MQDQRDQPCGVDFSSWFTPPSLQTRHIFQRTKRSPFWVDFSMAPNLGTLPVETLSLILGHFCLHCSKEHGYDSSNGHFSCRKSAEQQQPDQPSWYSRDYRQTLYSVLSSSASAGAVLAKLKTLDLCPSSDRWVFFLKHHAERILEAVAASRSKGSSLSTLNLHMCGRIDQIKLQGLHSVLALRLTHGRLYDEDLSVLLDSRGAAQD
ncbi:hypothetical protein N657DRAFT_409336 [Parathielavia appendiculata]|uniref:Uncharacterized protein n=1 Tax=Parathielavia appendiculata TaxID=2587402 RepID=A0AAN6TZL2_9PEZI|nr:hypothetical protein N657DRAFT_409336 [Parathielavia appendiculata]